MRKNISRRSDPLRKPSLSRNVRLGLRAIARKFAPRDDYDERAIAWINDTIRWHEESRNARTKERNR